MGGDAQESSARDDWRRDANVAPIAEVQDAVEDRLDRMLYGRQSINGYDSPPDTNLSYTALRRFLLPYRFPFGMTPWTGRYLTFQLTPTRGSRTRGPLAV